MTDATINPSDAPAAGARTHAGPGPKQVGAIVVGNALEFYDFLTFSFFAVQIGATFFPSANPTSSLLATLATFGAGFLTRPLGAFVIGRMGDKHGRKPAMLLTFGLMGVAILGLSLTPSYAQIGIIAPILVIGFRLLQGFALGGEVGPSTAFLLEAAPPHRRGFYVSFQLMSQGIAVLASGVAGVTLSNLLSPQDLTDWGWRVAFLIGALIVPFGLILRRSLSETLHIEEQPTAAGAPPQTLPVRVIVLSIAIMGAATICNYIVTYMSTYAQSVLSMPSSIAFGATVTHGLIMALFAMVGGLLADRFGPRPIMILPLVALAIVAAPAFHFLEQTRTSTALYGVVALLGMLQSTAVGACYAGVTGALPKRTRSAALAIIYAIAVSVFGGSAQFIVAWLTALTQNPLAPAFYMSGVIVIGVAAMLAMPMPRHVRAR
jgi:MHS family citrate/tricarballylate:H+ symporter-like MFS transporter